MPETNHQPQKTRIGTITLFLAGIIFAAYSGYMSVWRSYICAKFAWRNVQAPPPDIDTYLMRRIAFRQICGFSDHLASGAVFIVSTIVAAGAMASLRHRQQHPLGSEGTT